MQKLFSNLMLMQEFTNEDANWEEKFWEPLEVKNNGNEAFVTARTFKTHFTQQLLCKILFWLNGQNINASPTEY
jgi:maltose phosphorylase